MHAAGLDVVSPPHSILLSSPCTPPPKKKRGRTPLILPQGAKIHSYVTVHVTHDLSKNAKALHVTKNKTTIRGG